MILNYRDRLDEVSSMMKIRYDNDMSDRTGAMYAENDIELS